MRSEHPPVIMNKRTFLSKSFSATLGTLVAASPLSFLFGEEKNGHPNRKKIIGLQLYSLRTAMAENPLQTLKNVAEIGYLSLETAGYHNGQFYGHQPKAFRQIVEDLGMKVTSSHIGRSHDAKNPPATKDWWNRALDAQAELGCRYTIQPSFPIGATLDDIKLYSDYFNEIAEMSKSRQMLFGFHNHAIEFEERGEVRILDYLIENAAENMVFELDVYWAMKGGVDPAAYMRKHGKKIPLLHIKDESIIGDSELLDFEEIFNAAYEIGVKDYYVEVERYTPLPPLGCVERSFDYLNLAPYVK